MVHQPMQPQVRTTFTGSKSVVTCLYVQSNTRVCNFTYMYQKTCSKDSKIINTLVSIHTGMYTILCLVLM